MKRNWTNEMQPSAVSLIKSNRWQTKKTDEEEWCQYSKHYKHQTLSNALCDFIKRKPITNNGETELLIIIDDDKNVAIESK